jgi:hypothetical protein
VCGAHARPFRLVPELTRRPGIKLNERVSLRDNEPYVTLATRVCLKSFGW